MSLPLSRVHRPAFAALFLGPLAWAVHLEASYALVPDAQVRGTKSLLVVASLVTGLLAVGGVLFASTAVRRLRDGAKEPEITGKGAAFLSHGALYLCIFFAVVIVMESVPLFALGVKD